MRFIATVLFAFLLCPMGTLGPAFAQSVSESTQSTESEADKKEKDELREDQKALDKKLLGAWALITDDINAQMSEALFRKAAESCLKPPKITRLDAEPDLKTPLPDQKDIRGEVIYFRTDQGLQRFQTNPGAVFLLPDVKKAVNVGGQTVWQVSGKFAGFSIAFAEPGAGADVLLMVEQDKLYLKCARPPE